MKKSLMAVAILSALAQAQVLPLQTCIDKTLKNHPEVKSFVLSLEESKQDLSSSRSAYRPQLSAHLEYDPSRTYVMPQNGRFMTKDDDLGHADIMLRQKVWDFGKTTNRIDAAKMQKEISRLSLEDLKNRLRLRVEQVYDLLLLQKEMIALREHDLKTKQALYKQALAMQKQGLKTKADAARFLAAVYNAKETLSASKASYAKAKKSLEFLMGESIAKETTFENDLLRLEKLKLSTGDKEKLRKALLQNPSLRKIAKEIEKADRLYKAAKSERYGSIDLVASATHEESLSDYDTKMVGIKAEIPLYLGGKIKAQAQKAKIARAKVKSMYDSALLSYREKLEALFIDLAHTDTAIAAKAESIKASDEALRLIRGRYKVGLATYLQLLDALSAYKSAQTAYIGALAQKSDILYQIKSLTGADKL
jgi:outer membrane protein TolC